jgi:hypothetical protein
MCKKNGPNSTGNSKKTVLFHPLCYFTVDLFGILNEMSTLMKNFRPIYVLVLMSMVAIACSGRSQADEEADKPTSDQLYQKQGSIQQDMSPDIRDMDYEDTATGRVAEPRLIPDLSHVLSRETISPPIGFIAANTFAGTLPCANCNGIQTELTLLTNPTTGHRRYILKQTYLSTREGDQTYWESGPWEVYQPNHGQRIFRLSYEDEVHRRSFDIATDRIIRLLDQEGKPIDSQHNHSLYRLPAP